MKKALFLMIVWSWSALAFGQQGSPTETILSKLSNSPTQFKIYVAHDKPSYVAGETLWYTIYHVDATRHELNNSSKTLYIDLFAPDGSVVLSQMKYGNIGIAWGEFELPDSLSSGVYTIRSYTEYMKNFDPEFFFTKEIQIQGSNEEEVSSDTTLSDIRFFPEGGTFLIGTNNRIAFKATDNTGWGMDFEGILLDETGTILDSIRTSHDGMGEFNLVPAPGKKYRVETGNRQFDLPAVQFSGYALSTRELGENIEVFLYRNVSSSPEKMTIVAHTRNEITYVAEAELRNSRKIPIPKENLNDGISHITLLNQDGTPVCERLLFLNKAEGKMELDFEVDQKTLELREKVTANLKIRTPGVDSSAVFTMRVYNAVTDAKDNDLNIREYLLLVSDLRGKISAPGHYFEATEAARKNADLLMRTHGWTRFKWESLSTQDTLEYAVQQGVPMAGKVSRELSNRGAGNASLMIIDPKNGGLAQIFADDDGTFNTDALVFFDSTEIRIQASTEKGKKANYKVKQIPLQKTTFASIEPSPFSMLDSKHLELADILKRIQEGYTDTDEVIVLDEVAVKATRIKDEVHQLFGPPDRVLKTENLPPAFISVLELVRGRFAGVKITGSPLDPVVSIRGGETPLYIVDGIPVSQEALLSLSPQSIESVELMKSNSAAAYGTSGMNGVLAFFTKQGSGDYIPPSIGMSTWKVQGFNTPKEFYSPNYAEFTDKHNLPDQRITLFWAPWLIPNADGEIDVEFYTGDVTGEYILQIEGISFDGKPGVALEQIKVEN